MLSLLDHLRHQLPTLPEDGRYFVGFSGGLDSTVLLHALVSLKLDTPVIAVHINHQLSPNAAVWQAHCEDCARAYQVQYICCKVAVKNGGKGLEDAARQARYAAFADLLSDKDCLLTAHHANDQVETMLLHLLRGTGIRGLQGIAASRVLEKGRVLRPLLALPQQAIRAYAESCALHWIEDESNADPQFSRNFLRMKVLPVLEERWPNFSQRWSSASQSLVDADSLNRDLASLDLQAALPRRERIGHSIEYSGILNQSTERFNNLIRYWLAELKQAMPERTHLQQLCEQLEGGDNTQVEVTWGTCALRRLGQRLYCLPRAVSQEASIQLLQGSRWSMDSPLALPDGSCLTAVSGPGGLKAGEDYRVDFRRGGERCRPSGRAHSQTLKKLLQEYSLEPWLRKVVPLIYLDNQLVAVADLWVCEGFALATAEGQENTEGLHISWTYPEFP